jgi:outer membrane protein OmpA-like peptidoglycan-associated protein
MWNRRRVTVALLGVGLLFGVGGARAGAESGLSIGAEVGGGTMLSPYQRNVLNEHLALQGGLRLALALRGPIFAQVVARDWIFPSSSGYARATLVGAGLRLEPFEGRRWRPWIDGDAGLGLTGSHWRLGFDVGLGLALAATQRLGLGPFVRYGQVVATASDYPSDARFWAAGLAVTLRFLPPPPPPAPPPPPPPKPEPPRDTDGDAVVDRDDECPREPAGPDPDPLHRGCPSRDGDEDGIVDRLDRCPTTPAGPTPDPERAGCPDGDDDGDGVSNHKDECPTQPAGLHPDPARPGCPVSDRDRDTVPDMTDACPDQPGAPSPDAKKNGCPGMVRVEIDRLTIDRPVYFATDKDRILPKSFPVLRALADALKATPEIKRITIDGHADVKGTAAYNLDLSQRRADNIRTFLVQQGIAAERLESRGFGNTRPVESNQTEAGRAKNRRVEFIILDPPQPPHAEPRP